MLIGQVGRALGVTPAAHSQLVQSDSGVSNPAAPVTLPLCPPSGPAARSHVFVCPDFLLASTLPWPLHSRFHTPHQTPPSLCLQPLVPSVTTHKSPLFVLCGPSLARRAGLEEVPLTLTNATLLMGSSSLSQCMCDTLACSAQPTPTPQMEPYPSPVTVSSSPFCRLQNTSMSLWFSSVL